MSLLLALVSSGANTLTTAVGVYTLTGQSVALRTSRSLVVQQGQYTLTGQNITLRTSRALTIDTGVYALTGRDVGLRAARALVIQQGQYQLVGNDVVLRTARSLTTQTGVYGLTGQNVDLNVIASNQLVAQQGQYQLAGQDVVLTVGRVPTPTDDLLDPKFLANVRFKPITRKKPPEEPAAEEIAAPAPPPLAPKRRGALASVLDLVEAKAVVPITVESPPLPEFEFRRTPGAAPVAAPTPKPINYERVITALKEGWDEERAVLADEIDGLKAKLATTQAVIDAMHTQQLVERETNESKAKVRQRQRNAILAAEAARVLLEED